MVHDEEQVIERHSGSKIVLVSAVIGVAGMMPLLLYVLFGPVDGNPIGLGLLAMLSVSIAAIGGGIGFLKSLLDGMGDQEN